MISEGDNPGNILARWSTDSTEVGVLVRSKSFGFSGRGVLSAASSLEELEFTPKPEDASREESWKLVVAFEDSDISCLEIEGESDLVQIVFRSSPSEECILVGLRPIRGSLSVIQ